LVSGSIEGARAEDAYFRKAILELVYSGRRRQEEILDFFNQTFYNYQSEHIESLFSDFDLMGIIKSHVVYLETTNFMTFIGAPGYQLTPLGKATLDFLFNTFTTYDLDVFISLEKYVDDIDELKDDFNIIYTISKLFGGARLSKIPREKNGDIETFYERMGIEEVSHSEYSSYVIWHGWIENLPVEIIEDRYHVYTGNIERVARELNNLLSFTEILAEIKGKPITEGFSTLKQRVRRGYRLNEIPFVGLRFFGRVLLRQINDYCMNVLTKPPWNGRGTMIEILLQLKAQQTKEEFIQILSGLDMISRVRATRIFDFLETYVGRNKS
jgi:replicative superfamily II helicase